MSYLTRDLLHRLTDLPTGDRSEVKRSQDFKLFLEYCLTG